MATSSKTFCEGAEDAPPIRFTRGVVECNNDDWQPDLITSRPINRPSVPRPIVPFNRRHRAQLNFHDPHANRKVPNYAEESRKYLACNVRRFSAESFHDEVPSSSASLDITAEEDTGNVIMMTGNLIYHSPLDNEVQHTVKPEMNTLIAYTSTDEINSNSQSKLGLAMYDSPVKDFSFQVKDEIIPIHKIVLAAHSSYFYQQFNEKLGNTMDTVKVDKFDKEVVDLAVKACYDQPFDETTLDDIIIWQLFDFATAYDISCVLDLLSQSLSEPLVNEENVCQLAVHSIEASDLDLFGKCVTFISDLLNKNQPIPDIEPLPTEFFRAVILTLATN